MEALRYLSSGQERAAFSGLRQPQGTLHWLLGLWLEDQDTQGDFFPSPLSLNLLLSCFSWLMSAETLSL